MRTGPWILCLTSLVACGRTAAVQTAAGPAYPPGITAALVARGDSLFNNGSCVRCHGARGIGGQNGPSLVNGPWLHHRGTPDEIAATIATGVPRTALKDASRRPMNPRGGPMNLTDEQVKAVAAYVWSISRAKTAP